jgi:protein TonB
MRLTLSLLAATAVHGAVFGVAAIVLSHRPAEVVAPVPVEVEVVAARPDPIADPSPALAPAGPSRSQEPAPARPRIVRRARDMALVGNPTRPSAPADSSAIVDAPAAAAVPPAVPPSAAATASSVSAPQPAAQGGGGVVSATAHYRSNPKPDYPIPSKRRREEGIVLLNVQVQVDGTPAAVSLNRSCGHPLLDRAALDAVRHWTFEPARADGVPISSLVVVHVRFSLADQP